MSRSRTALSVCMLALLSGCIDSVGLQREYVASRDGCRDMAEMKMGLYVQSDGFPINEKEKNAMLLSLFSECMRGENWAVAKPKDPPKEPGAPPTEVAGTVPPVGNTLPISTTSALARPGVPGAVPGQQYMLVPVPAQPTPGAATTAPVTTAPVTTAPVTAVPPAAAPVSNTPAPVQYAPVVVPVQPQPQKPKTVLRNKGVGVGVGPSYSLEKVISKE